MPKTHHILHVANHEEDLKSFAQAFSRSSLQAVLHSVSGTADTFLFLAQVDAHLDIPRPKLIILEARQPEQYVWYLLKFLKGNPRLRSIPVVVMTDAERYIDVLRCSSLTFDDYVIRPSGQHELVETIASLDRWLLGSSSGKLTTV